jgi:hypothetical protein
MEKVRKRVRVESYREYKRKERELFSFFTISKNKENKTVGILKIVMPLQDISEIHTIEIIR